ncbi:MAG: hypothetical protein J7L55_05485 [Desulfurococcales archaeon]|nr:hypothetical protein [Desulfurococcales archaeon]
MRNLLLISLIILAAFAATSALTPHAATLEVGEGYEYQNITSAINDANDGDVIIVHQGTYNETLTIYAKHNLTITGAPGESVTINPSGSYSTPVTIIKVSGESTQITIKNLRIVDSVTNIEEEVIPIEIGRLSSATLQNLVIRTGSDSTSDAIRITSAPVNITNLTIIGTSALECGVYVSHEDDIGSTNKVTIANSTIMNVEKGIYVISDDGFGNIKVINTRSLT